MELRRVLLADVRVDQDESEGAVAQVLLDALAGWQRGLWVDAAGHVCGGGGAASNKRSEQQNEKAQRAIRPRVHFHRSCFGFHCCARFSASAIWSGVIFAAAMFRFSTRLLAVLIAGRKA
jgi:hypothetical protein